MKNIIVVILMLTAVVSVKAQSPSEIIKSVKEHYEKVGAVETKIAFTIDVPESEKTMMNGLLYLKGNKYRFVLDDQEIISDDVNQWHWTKGDINEVQVSYIDENEESTITPSKIFSKFLRGFGYKLIGKSKFRGRDVAIVEIRPDSKIEGNDIYKIRVVTDLKTNELIEMKLFENSGVEYLFEILEQKTVTIKDNFFQFNKANHTEVEVIDLR